MGGMHMFYFTPTLVIQEEDCIKNHWEEICSFGKKALLVTGRHSAKENGSQKDLLKALIKGNVEYAIYDKIEENPSVETVVDAAKFGIAENVDFVIGVGGGSPMDASKAIALLIKNKQEDGTVLYEETPMESLPVLCVPTTCGTGSEVTPYSILTRHDKKTKQSISHHIFPKIALVDAKYMEYAKRDLIASTAIDAVGHLIESYFNVQATPYSRILALEGMRVFSQVKDAVLKESMHSSVELNGLLMASTVAGMAISHTGTSIPHGLSYYLTYNKQIPHGKAVGVFLPAYLECVDNVKELNQVLDTLGFADIAAVKTYITKAVGEISVTITEFEHMIDQIGDNKKKLSQCPFPMDKERLRKMVASSVKIS